MALPTTHGVAVVIPALVRTHAEEDAVQACVRAIAADQNYAMLKERTLPPRVA